MRYFLWALILFALASSCATPRQRSDNSNLHLRPPGYSAASTKQASDSKPLKNEIWFINYKQAQQHKSSGQFELACDLFKNLSLDHDFPLKELAQIRSIESCPIEKIENKDLDVTSLVDYQKVPDWLSEEAFELQLKLAKDLRDERQIITLLIESSKKNLPKREKVSRMLAAIQLAKNNSFEDLIPSAEQRLRFLAPRFVERPKPSQWMDVADDFRQDMQFEKAIAYYRQILKFKRFTLAHKIAASRGIARTYKLQRKKTEYVEWTAKAAKIARNAFVGKKNVSAIQNAYLRAQLELVRAQWTENQYSTAFKGLLLLEKDLKGKQSLAEVYWLMARMKEERQEFKLAGDYFSQAAQEPIADRDFKEKVGWHLAWNLRKNKAYELAGRTLEDMIATTKNPFRKARFSYWMARTLVDSGESTRARQLYNEIVADDTIGYYGILASKELKRPIGFPTHETYRLSTYEPSVELSDEFSPLLIDWLIAVNEKSVAKSYLDLHRQKLLKRETVSDDTWLYMYHLYARNQLFNELFGSLYSLNVEQRSRILNRDPELLFPKPFHQVVQNAAKQFSVRPELIYSIMRQESAFNPEARSHADAFGLMQLLPEVAQQTSDKRELMIYRQPTDLFDPTINIPLGAAFIDELHKKYQNRVLLVAASYNASDEAIAGWLKTRFRGDTIEFIEDIPFEETQDYLKLILRNYLFYMVIENGSKPVDFPDWILDLGFSDT